MSWQGRNCSPCSSARRFIMSAYGPGEHQSQKRHANGTEQGGLGRRHETLTPLTARIRQSCRSVTAQPRPFDVQWEQGSAAKRNQSIRVLCMIRNASHVQVCRLALTYTALVQQAERAAPEGGEAHAEDGANVAVYGGRDYPVLQAEHSLVHKPGKS